MTEGHDTAGHDTDSQDDAPETTIEMAIAGRRRRRQGPDLGHGPSRWRRHIEVTDGRRLGFLGSLIGLATAGLALLAVMAPSIGNNEASSGFQGCGSYAPLAPTGSGVVRPVTSQAQLAAAMAAAQPGDTINLASGRYREIHYRQAYGHRSGTADRPIVIQAATGAEAVIDGGQVDDSEMTSAVDVGRRQHIKIRGLTVRDRSFGLRSMGSSHITFEYNDVADVGHSGIVAQVYHKDPTLPSTAVVIRCNRIHDTGRVAPEYGEGIYIGTGSVLVPDPTSNILIEGNDIFRTSNEGIDIKHHVTNVTIRDNDIHDLTPYYGGAISLGLNNRNWGPANYLVENNRIWNVSSGMYYAQAIAVGHGPTVIRDNLIWGVESETTSSWPWIHPIQIHGDDGTADWISGFGNPAANQVEITGNTVVGCQVACIDSYTEPGAVAPNLTMGVNVVTAASSRDAATDNDHVVAEADFLGPTSGTADAGSGPGSGLALIVDATPSTFTVSTTVSTTTTAESLTRNSARAIRPSTTASVSTTASTRDRSTIGASVSMFTKSSTKPSVRYSRRSTETADTDTRSDPVATNRRETTTTKKPDTPKERSAAARHDRATTTETPDNGAGRSAAARHDRATTTETTNVHPGTRGAANRDARTLLDTQGPPKAPTTSLAEMAVPETTSTTVQPHTTAVHRREVP